MRRSIDRRWAGALALCVVLMGGTAEQARAQGANGGVTDSALRCVVDGSRVELSWQIQFFAPIAGWVISRDGEDIAKLEPDAARYVDEKAPDGEHLYELSAVALDGRVDAIARCSVIAGDFHLRCKVDGTDVHLEWGPILIDVLISSFVIRRDGEVIARPPSSARAYTDENVPAGRHRYVIHMVVDIHEVLLGACTARVEAPAFSCQADPPLVHLDWTGVPLPEIVIEYFLVVRDGERIARTKELSYTDRPGPGEHAYSVWGIAGPEPDSLDAAGASVAFLVGECGVVLPGDGVPPPEELTCVDLDEPPLAVELDELLGPHDVLLVWQKPVEYDRVLILRGNLVVATIDGSQFWFVERNVPTGHHIYSVHGVVGDHVSPPATCEVWLPRPPVEPPRDLQCRYIGVGDPDDPADTPDGSVHLEWQNGEPYEWIVIVHNGRAVARIPGVATSFNHDAPAPGRNFYAVFGVVGLFRSGKAECTVDVPVGVVPSVQNLRCLLVVGAEPIDPVDPVDPVDPNDPNDPNGAVVGADGDVFKRPIVLLSWQNPASTAADRIVYDKIIVARNKMIVATLPGDAESYRDVPPGPGKILYSVIGVIGDRQSEPTSCELEIPPPFLPPPQNLECVAYSGPISPDDASLLPAVKLGWDNPVRYRALVVERDGEPVVKLPGDAMIWVDIDPPAGHHVYSVYGLDHEGNESDKVSCEVDVPPVPVPPVEHLTCIAVSTNATGPSAVLQWKNAADYDRILVLRDGELISTLPGSATRHIDGELAPDVYHYAVVAVRGGLRSAPRECRVVIPGLPPRNLLYYSSGIFEPVEPDPNDPASDDVEVRPIIIGSRLVCMASNSDPLQGWSFGACSDPSVLKPAEATIEGTETAELNGGTGPDFLHVEVFEQGVAMAVMVSKNLAATLPVGGRHTLLQLRYERGPDAQNNTPYPVKYCRTLGDPPVEVLYVVKGFGVRPATAPGFVTFPAPIEPGFVRADSNADGNVDMSDAMYTLNWLFLGGPEPQCKEAANANGDGDVNLADPVYTLQALFAGGPVPPPPFPNCGTRPAPLGCVKPSCPSPLAAQL